jgi:hypothetical protein
MSASPQGASGHAGADRVLDRVLDGVAVVRQSDNTLIYANAALRELVGGSENLNAAVRERLRTGRTEAVDLAHPDLGAIRLIVFPRDPRRSAERAWRHDLRRELARARRRSRSLTVAAIALDAGGSTQLAAAAWATVLRDEDSLTPHEGGAYLAVLVDCTLDDAHTVAARLREATPPPASASVGLAASRADEELESLVARAFDALAQARVAGGNQVQSVPEPRGGHG